MLSIRVRPIAVAVRPSADHVAERWLRDAPAPRDDELRPLPGVEPAFDLSGLQRVDVDVQLDADGLQRVARLRSSGALGATTDGEVLRAVFFRWWAVAEATGVPFAREE